MEIDKNIQHRIQEKFIL